MTTDANTLFLDAWNENVADRKKRSPSFELEQYTATGRASAQYGGKRNVQWWLDQGPQMVQDYIDWREETKWPLAEVGGKPAVEVELNFEIPGVDVPIKAFIDRVFEPTARNTAVVDIKTGRTPETAEQLGLYRVGLGIVYGIWPDFGYFWSPGGKNHGNPIPLMQYTPEYFARVYSKAIAGINAGAFLAHPANSCKNWCGVARYCQAVGGHEARGNDPDAG